MIPRERFVRRKTKEKRKEIHLRQAKAPKQSPKPPPDPSRPGEERRVPTSSCARSRKTIDGSPLPTPNKGRTHASGGALGVRVQHMPRSLLDPALSGSPGTGCPPSPAPPHAAPPPGPCVPERASVLRHLTPHAAPVQSAASGEPRAPPSAAARVFQGNSPRGKCRGPRRRRRTIFRKA